MSDQITDRIVELADFDRFPIHDDHVFVYLRISTDRQNITSQLNEIYNYCNLKRLYPPSVNIYMDENVSGKVSWKKRQIATIIDKCKKGSIILTPELSRLGRNMNEVNQLIAICDETKVTIHDVKNKLVLDGTFQSSIMAQLYSIFGQMERQLISERTKQGMLVAKQKGHLTGRKRGIKKNICDKYVTEIKEMLALGKTLREISKVIDVCHSQIHAYLKRHPSMKEFVTDISA